MLNRGSGEIAETIRPLLEKQSAGQVVEDLPAAPEKAAPAVPVEKAVAEEASPLAAVRTMSLRLPAPSPLLPFEEGQWRASEQYRILRTKISQHAKQPRVIVVSSPSPGDGKSVTAINTAGALSLK